jgi:hypothetical protein
MNAVVKRLRPKSYPSHATPGLKKNQKRAPGIVEDFFDLRMMQMAAGRLLQQNGMYSDRFLMPSRCGRSMADNLMP